MMHRRSDTGIALLEMLIALMIMAMLAVMTAAAFGTFGRVLSTIGQSEGRLDWALSQRQVQIWAQDWPSGLDQGNPIAVNGDPMRLQFQTIDQSGRFWQGALITVLIEIEGAALVARVTGKPNASAVPETVKMILDQGPVSSVRMSYFGKHDLARPPHWKGEWRAAPRIPDLIKIEWQQPSGAAVPLILEPGITDHQTFRSLSSLSPPG